MLNIYNIQISAQVVEEIWDQILVDYVSNVSMLENSTGLEINKENFPGIDFIKMEKLSFLYQHLFGEGAVEFQASGETSLTEAQEHESVIVIESDVSSPDIEYSTTHYTESGYASGPRIKSLLKFNERSCKTVSEIVEKYQNEQEFTEILVSVFDYVAEEDKSSCYLHVLKSLKQL